ncbi:MAG: outer membrane beta-barrel protein [Thiolinea sp.]
MNKFNLTTAVFFSMFASSAFAGGASPFYLGATIGSGHVDNGASQMDNYGFCEKAHADNEDCRIGDGGSVGHIYGGFQISESLAIEAGYADLGNTASYYYTDPIDVSQETTGITVAGVLRHRVSQTSPLHVYGKAGAMRWTTETHSRIDYPGTAKDSGVSALVGAGLEYELNHNVSLKAGWDRYYDVGESAHLVEIHDHGHDINTLETDVDVYSAGVNVSFF